MMKKTKETKKSSGMCSEECSRPTSGAAPVVWEHPIHLSAQGELFTCVREGREGWREDTERVRNRGDGESMCDPLTSTLSFCRPPLHSCGVFNIYFFFRL